MKDHSITAMVKNSFYIGIIALFFCACKQPVTLDKNEAMELIREYKKYPEVYPIDINRLDPLAARTLKEKNLDGMGLLSFKESYSMQDEGKVPLVYFSDKAKPYLLPAKTGQDTTQERSVRVANIDVINIAGIEINGNVATVQYQRGYTNLTPFQVLVKRDLTKDIKTETINLTFTNMGWMFNQ